MEVRIENLNVGITDDVGSRDFFFAFHINADYLRLIACHLEAELLQVQNDIRHVIPDTRNRGELMEYAIDPNGGNCSTFQRGQQHAAQAIAKRRTVATLERFTDEFTVTVIFTDFRNFNFRFLDVYHLK